MRNDTKYHKAFGNAAIFSLSTSISQIMASTKANVNIILFQLASKNVAVVHISKGISDITPNTRSVTKYLHLVLVWKYPSTRRKINIGKAILPKISKKSLNRFNAPPSKFG